MLIETAQNCCYLSRAAFGLRSIHPQGWVPIETCVCRRVGVYPLLPSQVAFTPKGGCPLKQCVRDVGFVDAEFGSIHPQGWVPIETGVAWLGWRAATEGSIHPQGWVPIETESKGSCLPPCVRVCSIHPQGWVRIETSGAMRGSRRWSSCSIHPQGWVPIETRLLPKPEEAFACGS